MGELTAGEAGANCGAPRTGEYCHRCGQHFLDRLTIAVLVQELVARLSFDHGILHTAVEMTRDPGGVVRRYINGQRRRYVSPLTYLFFGAALTLLTFPLYDDIIREWSRSLLATPLDDTPMLNREQRLLYAELQVDLYSQTTWVTLALCIPFTLLVRLFFRGSGITLAEAGVFAFFVVGQTAVVQALISPPLFRWLPVRVASLVSYIPFAVIISMAAAQFFGWPWRSMVKVNVAMLVAYLVAGVILSGALLAYIAMFR